MHPSPCHSFLSHGGQLCLRESTRTRYAQSDAFIWKKWLLFPSYRSALPNFLSEYLVLKFRLLKRFKGWNAESRKEWKNQRKQNLLSPEEQLETLAVTSPTESIWQKSTT